MSMIMKCKVRSISKNAMASDELVPIIDEEGNVLRGEKRSVAHAEGLLHLGARVIVKLPDGKIVFQRRSLSKETNPGMLAITAGGHVQYGQTLEEAAAAELLEETGIVADPKEFAYLGKRWIQNGFIHGMPHRVLGYYYGYRYLGTIEDFKVEEEDGDGFETFTYEELEALTPEGKARFCDTLLDPDMMEFFKNA